MKESPYLRDRGARLYKQDLVNLLYAETTLGKRECREAVTGLETILTQALLRNQIIVMQGFGVLENRARQGRSGVNPRTGEPVDIPATVVPSFSAGKTLKRRVRDAVSYEELTDRPKRKEGTP